MEKDFPEIVTDILKRIGRDVDSPFLFHYTDGQSLKSIIEKSQLWSTERNYMNDIVDETFVKDAIRHKLSNRADFPGSLLEREMFTENAQYVFSTSLEKDLIHQWAYYGNNDAYCIEFKRPDLRSYFWKSRLEDDRLYFGPILYDTNDIKVVIDEVTQGLTESITKLTRANPDPLNGVELHETAKKVYQYFYSLIKQPGHYCEKEFRFLIQSSRKPSFKIKNGLFVPYIEIGNKRRRLPINKIYVGPNNHDQLAIKSLKQFLEENKYGKVGVGRSDLLMRRNEK